MSYTDDLSEIDKQKLALHMKESDYIKSEIKSIQETQRRMITFIPPIIAIGIPLLLKPTSSVDEILTISIFLGFGFLFLFLVTIYIGLMRGILRLSNYHGNYIVPKINLLLHSTPPDVFLWGYYIREKIRTPRKELAGYLLIHASEFILLFSPSGACIVIGLYLASTKELQWLFWICLVIYIVMLGITIYYAFRTAYESRIHPARYVYTGSNQFFKRDEPQC